MQMANFEELVQAAIDDLPDYFRARLDNVAIVVEDWADQETLRAAGVKRPIDLLGFYHGVPLTKRTSGYMLVPPDKISIYRQPILMQCRTWQAVQDLVTHVVRHEVAHYFGISDDRLKAIGAY